jgi:murein DD-endopeptidase MepM/ murein hydrolase activator NlpD
LDYYSGFCGVPVNFGDPVYAAGDGVIDRIDHVYSEPATAQRDEMLRDSIAAGNTPEAVLDKLRGRQVWINHAYGVVTRYAHLHEVSEQLQVGDRVEAGAFIGTVGNSGTSSGAEGSQDGPHLHFEIRLGDSYLGEGMDPVAVRLLLQKILDEN